METDFILNACAIKGDGFCDLLDSKTVSQALRDDSLGWVHLDGNNPKTRTWLSENISHLDNLVIDALLAGETRPRIIEFDKGAMMILRGVNLNENADPEDMVSIRLWIDAHRIISVQRRPLKATKDIQEKLLEGNGPKDSGEFIAMLAARLFERMEPVFQELDERLDDIEEKVIENPDISERQEIAVIRKQAIIFRRYISPQRDVIAHLRTSEMDWIDAMQKRRLQESLDRVTRYIEDLDTIRERAQIVKDELSSVLSDKMNNNLYMLSLVAAIFLPLGFFTGLLGINVGGIPGSENPNAFMIFCGILITTVIIQIIIFKKLKWL
jgi:zinc transporter